MISESLSTYYRDKVIDDANENNDVGNYRINKNKTITSKSFENRTKIIRSTPDDGNVLSTEVVLPLKYLVVEAQSAT